MTVQDHPVTPAATAAFEHQFQEILREMGRVVTQWTYNHVEPAAVEALTKHVVFQGELYTRLNRWKLPCRFPEPNGPRSRAWVPPPPHAFREEKRRC